MFQYAISSAAVVCQQTKLVIPNQRIERFCNLCETETCSYLTAPKFLQLKQKTVLLKLCVCVCVCVFDRMREKLSEYAAEGAPWPLAASILDPVRLSIVCEGPAQILEVCMLTTSRKLSYPS